MKQPHIHPSAFIAPNATVLGDVTVGEESSFFFGAVARSEFVPIVIGKRTNIQDNCVLHADPGIPMTIGDDVTVGHGAILHSCTVGSNSLIGMGAIVLNGAVLGEHCLVGAGAVVTGKMNAPAGSLILGNPATVVKPLTQEQIDYIHRDAEYYLRLAENAFGEK